MAITESEVRNAEVTAMCEYLGRVNNTGAATYRVQIEGAYAEAWKVRRNAGFVLVHESAISPVRGPGADK